jgi:hypothetical protein
LIFVMFQVIGGATGVSWGSDGMGGRWLCVGRTGLLWCRRVVSVVGGRRKWVCLRHGVGVVAVEW